jgi:hypothetical protein
MSGRKVIEKQADMHRVWARLPDEAYKEMMTLARRLGINLTKLVQISAIAGYKSIYRASFPEDSVPAEWFAKLTNEMEKLNKEKNP